MGLDAKPGDWEMLLSDSFDERREKDGPIPIPEPKPKKSTGKAAAEEKKELKLKEKLAKIDPDFTVKRILNIINREVEKLEKKQDKEEELTPSEAKLLDSYISAVLKADEKLSIGKKNLSDKNISKMSEEELRLALGIK